MSNSKIYKDLDLNFTINPLTGDVDKKVGLSAIKQSLKNIINYAIFEKPYMSEMDIGVKKLIFNNKYSGFERVLQTKIQLVIESFEPRVIVHKVLVTSKPEDNDLKINIYYTPIEQQTPDTLELFLGKYENGW